jgi:hypothetical protein
MLSPDEINELFEKVKQGKAAEDLLKKYNELTETKRNLENLKNICNTGCRRITVEYDHNSNLAFSVNLPTFAIAQLRKILDNEISFIGFAIEDLNK